MARLSEQLEREAEDARQRLAADLAEFRDRMTPGQIMDEVTDYARDTPAAEFLRNLMRDIRENPLPLLLIGAGVGWSMLAAALRPARRAQPVEVPSEPAVSSLHPSAPVVQQGEWEVAPMTPAAD